MLWRARALCERWERTFAFIVDRMSSGFAAAAASPLSPPSLRISPSLPTCSACSAHTPQ
jgi:hypothetical protein